VLLVTLRRYWSCYVTALPIKFKSEIGSKPIVAIAQKESAIALELEQIYLPNPFKWAKEK
jgi:hypothetical protein